MISQFNSLDLRNDVGQLWENFIITERMKNAHTMKYTAQHISWRTYDQQEIDLIEERDGKLLPMKLNGQTKTTIST